MLQSYLLIFDNNQILRQSILDYLDTQPIVKNWLAVLPAGIIIISHETAFELSKVFRERFPNQFFMCTEISRGANDGWLTKENWDFINEPKSSGRWP